MKISGYKIISKNNYNNLAGGAGVAIIIKENIKAEIREDIHAEDEDIDCVAIQIKYGNRKTNRSGIYRRPGKITKRSTWIKMLKKCDRRNEIILTGDFNSHHTLWNCETCDVNGETLLEEIEDRNLYIVNRDTTSRIGNFAQRDSNLDLMFCSEDLIDLIDYQQINDPWDSDHLPIIYNIGELTLKSMRRKHSELRIGKRKGMYM